MKIAVIGCGAMGAATGWRLASRGIAATCFDRYSPPHELGSSHGDTRITRTAYYEGPWYVPLLQRTFPLWRELERSTGAGLLTLNGALMIGSPGAEVVAGAVAAAAAHHLDHRVLSSAEVRSRYRGHVMRDEEVAALDTQGGFVRPEGAITAMIGRMTDLGGVLLPNTAVTAVESRRDGVEVITQDGRQSFDRVVVSAGARVRDLIPWLPLTVTRQVLAWFEMERNADWLTPERFPVFFHHTTELGDVYGFPTVDGLTVKLARHHGGDPTDPDTIQRQVSEADLALLRAFAARYLRGVSQRVARATVCMYTNTPDRHFIIDFDPADPRIVILSPCSGHGFKFAPVIGDIAADLVTRGGTAHDVAHFSIARFNELAAAASQA
jgi:sarcosine oxidase